MGEHVALVAPVDLGLGAGNDLEAAVQPGQRVLIHLCELGGDQWPHVGQVHLGPLVVAGEAVLGDSRSWITDAFNVTSTRSHTSITLTNGVIALGWAPARGGADGGVEGESSFRYFLTVRQSHPHSRAISA